MIVPACEGEIMNGISTVLHASQSHHLEESDFFVVNRIDAVPLGKTGARSIFERRFFLFDSPFVETSP